LAQIINNLKNQQKKNKINLCRNCSGSMVFVSSGHLVAVYVLKNLGAICGYALLHQNVMVLVLACQFEGHI
jgi:hypothetical protein